jgi:hypothetical protein
MRRTRVCSWLELVVVLLLIPAMGAAQNVTTRNYDNFRTGWDSQELSLTQSNVGPTTFSRRAIVETLDEQVDAQPVILSNQTINGTLYPTVVYVATENNTVYAIDGLAGTILLQTTLESAAPIAQIFGGSCSNNSGRIGINSTPVIDATAGRIYVVTATIPSGGTLTFHLHALSVATLVDQVTPLTITPPAGTSINRQRGALTLFNSGVLIPFASFCDNSAPTLGFMTYANMSVTPAVQTSFQASHTFLDSIWMSGGGPAVNGNFIYFLTGNGNVALTPPPNTELPHSIVRLTGSSGTPLSLTYSTATIPDTSIMGTDKDYGAGGVMIVPSGAPTSIGPGTTASFLTGAGKTGNLYLFGTGLGSFIQSLPIGACWCGPAYFTGSDGLGHVVTGGGTTLQLNTVNSASLTPSSSVQLPAKAFGDPGLWTTVSSNGTAAGTGVIWTVSGPDSNTNLTLYAYNANNLSLLFSAVAGSWGNTGGNANVVPVVSNGHVYVASDGELTIFGLTQGAVPLPPTSITANFSACPAVTASWAPSTGATSYQLFEQFGNGPWNPTIAGLFWSGTATHVVTGHFTSPGLYQFDVAACNSFGCSAVGTPAGANLLKNCSIM